MRCRVRMLDCRWTANSGPPLDCLSLGRCSRAIPMNACLFGMQRASVGLFRSPTTWLLASRGSWAVFPRALRRPHTCPMTKKFVPNCALPDPSFHTLLVCFYGSARMRMPTGCRASSSVSLASPPVAEHALACSPAYLADCSATTVISTSARRAENTNY